MPGIRLGSLERSVLIALGVFFCVASFFLSQIPSLALVVVISLIMEVIERKQGKELHREVQEIIERSDLREIQLTKRRLERQKLRLQARIKRFSLAMVIYTGVLFGIIALNTSPWLPTELLTFTNGRPPEIVYVLSSSDTGYVFMNAATRQIEFASSGIIKNQAICSAKSDFLNDTIPALLSAGPDYASCRRLIAKGFGCTVKSGSTGLGYPSGCWVSPGDGQLNADGVADLTRGRRLYACPRSGGPGRPHKPDGAAARGPRVKSAAAPRLPRLSAARSLPFAPADRALEARPVS